MTHFTTYSLKTLSYFLVERSFCCLLIKTSVDCLLYCVLFYWTEQNINFHKEVPTIVDPVFNPEIYFSDLLQVYSFKQRDFKWPWKGCPC